MMNWIDVNSSVKPPENRVLLCYCPEWSETGYQVARWSEETGFERQTVKNPTRKV